MGSQRVGHDWVTLTLSLSPGKEMSQNLKPYRKLSFHDNSKGVWTAKRAENLAELLWLADSHLESSFLVECIEWHHVYTGRTINYMKTTLRKHLKTLFLHTLKALVAQSCLTLCDPMDCSSPGFSAHGILQARTLKEVGIHSLPRRSSQPRDWTWVSCVAGGFLTAWVIRETHTKNMSHIIGL